MTDREDHFTTSDRDGCEDTLVILGCLTVIALLVIVGWLYGGPHP